MKKITKLTHAMVAEALRYDPSTGDLIWASNNRRRKAGAIAGTKKIYIQVQLGGTSHLAHRLIWFLVYGEMPSFPIDHIDGNPHNNRLENLRAADAAINSQNRRRPMAKKQSDLPLGVYHAYKGRFSAAITAGGRQQWLGSFNTPNDAYAAYVEAKKRLHAGNTL